MSELKGLVTGIGSLPHKDAAAALDLIFKYFPEIPFWPQLPKRDMREGMVAQFSENLPCLKITPSGLIFDSAEKEKELERFYERIILHDVEYFKISPAFALGLHSFYQRCQEQNLTDIKFIKGQVTGPFTFAASVNDEQGVALLHDPVFMQVVLKAVAMKALWQIKFFTQFGKRIILFIDEPYLSCFGSAYTPLNREEVVKGLSELATAIKSEGVLLGVHCCGNTDWSIFTEIESIDIISFDAFGFLDRLVLYADSLKKFLQKSGILCWGIVPTQEFSLQITAQALISKIKGAIHTLVKKGVDKDLLLENLCLSPSCGLGTLDADKSTKIFSCLLEVKNKLFDTFGGHLLL